MATITDLLTNTTGAASLTIINDNFDNLNTDKLEISGGTMTGRLLWSNTDVISLQLQSLTTTERDLLSPANGDVIYNETDDKVQLYEGGAWADASAAGADASTSVKGVAKLSYAPASATNPIAVGDNDPRVLSSADATLVGAITSSAVEINQLDGATISAAQLTEAGTFFGATDISGAEAETLTDGSETSLHSHPLDLLANLLYPIPYNSGFEAISITNTTYTVTAGKTLIITGFTDGGGSLEGMQIDDAAGTLQTVARTSSGGSGDASGLKFNTFFARSGAEVAVSANTVVVGYEVTNNAKVTPVCETIDSSTTYTVPADSIFVMTNVWSESSANFISVNLGTLFNVQNKNNINGTDQANAFNSPILFEAGDALDTSGSAATINGYLIDIS